MKIISALVGATMMAGGAAKLASIPAYEQAVADLDWTPEERRRIGVAELTGGAMMLFKPTRRLGAGVVLTASGQALTAELKAGQVQLAAPRAVVTLAALLVSAFG